MAWKRPKNLGWIISGIVIVALIVIAILPKPLDVEMTEVTKGLVRTTISAEGRIRYLDRFVVSMPVTGVVSRIEREPGDSVHAGDIIGWYTAPALDPRVRDEATARAEAVSSMQAEAKERLAALEPLIDQAKRRAERTERLQAAGAVSKESWENARDAYTQLRSERVALQARLKSAEYEARAARAAIAATPGSRVALIAPVDGVVLRRFEEQERMAMAGTPVIEIGGMRGKELVIDVLSTDAVRIRTGMNVLIDGWGGERTLRAHVIRVEPAATIKVSALGVEEKRVNVIAALDDDDAALGDTYKVDANVVLWESPSAVTVPLGALVRTDRGWVVWVVSDNTVQKRDVTIGHRAALNAEVVKGLTVGETVVVHPPEALEEGSRVE